VRHAVRVSMAAQIRIKFNFCINEWFLISPV
jgi:hypothetical protein